jgi:hypothetical protein
MTSTEHFHNLDIPHEGAVNINIDLHIVPHTVHAI